MHRGVYFDGWYPRQHNYHPSLPARRLRMIDDLADMRATTLVWSALGGGSISLPYLEDEAYGEIPARFRMYGFVNDSEFIGHAAARGIDVFGIVFECQGWEFPVEYDSSGQIVALNELRGAGERGWIGLREFTQDIGPASWKPFGHYFPDGIANSLGQPVTDLLAECCSRDLEGNPIHARWVEAPDREHRGYCMDRNNPVWREYLKAVIRIQIDAGVAGVQLDESETPMGAMRYGGCFCQDCMQQFRSYLQRVATGGRDPELRGLDLDSFDYRTFLLEQGFKAGDPPRTMPLYHHFCQFLVGAITATYKEMADYARQYGAAAGRDIKVAGNFFNCSAEYDAMVAASDLLVTEMKLTGACQPWWFRHAAGFSQGRDVLVVENPYGGVVPQLADELNQGKSYDLFRLSIYEGAAMGTSMTLPYGSWLGSEIEDSYWAPKFLTDEVGQFLESIDGLRSQVSANEVAVLYCAAAELLAEIDGGKWDEPGEFPGTAGGTASTASATGYWDVIQRLSSGCIPFDCVVLPDERHRDNDVTSSRLARYRTVIAAGCRHMSQSQHRALMGYLESGGSLLVVGDYAVDLREHARREVINHERANATTLDALTGSLSDRQIICPGQELLAMNLDAISESETALHIVNYDFSREEDACRPRTSVDIAVRTRHRVAAATVYAPGRRPQEVTARPEGSCTRFTIPVLSTYAVVRLAT